MNLLSNLLRTPVAVFGSEEERAQREKQKRHRQIKLLEITKMEAHKKLFEEQVKEGGGDDDSSMSSFQNNFIFFSLNMPSLLPCKHFDLLWRCMEKIVLNWSHRISC